MTENILKNCTVEGNIVKLPEGQLDRNVYLEIKKKLELIGGKWKGGKTQGFVFEEDPAELLEAVANGDNRNLKKEYQFFATPANVAEIMIGNLGFIKTGAKILEPSAGDGAIIKRFFALRGADVVFDCYEAMDLNRIKLSKLENVNIRGNDFLEAVNKDNYYDIVIANPPFTKNQDIDHIRKMYEVCKPGGTIVTLSSSSWMIGSQKKQEDFKLWLTELGADVEEIEAGAFKESGTAVGCLMITINKKVEEVQLRKCRVCGCTDNDCSKCIEKTGSPCHWVEGDLCSACVVQEPEDVLEEKTVFENSCTRDDQIREPEFERPCNFFKEFYPLLDGIDVSIKLKRKNGRLTISLLPETTSVISPAILTGTPEELDNGFFNAITFAILEAKGLKVDLDNYKKSLEKSKEKKEDNKPESEKPKAETKKTSAKKTAKGKPVKKEEKTKIIAPDLFATV